ncbi:hypothetical protein FKM82_022935 [Ascaphus truei]
MTKSPLAAAARQLGACSPAYSPNPTKVRSTGLPPHMKTQRRMQDPLPAETTTRISGMKCQGRTESSEPENPEHEKPKALFRCVIVYQSECREHNSRDNNVILV